MKVVLPVPPSYHVRLKSNATLFKVKERSTDMQRKYRAQNGECSDRFFFAIFGRMQRLTSRMYV